MEQNLHIGWIMSTIVILLTKCLTDPRLHAVLSVIDPKVIALLIVGYAVSRPPTCTGVALSLLIEREIKMKRKNIVKY